MHPNAVNWAVGSLLPTMTLRTISPAIGAIRSIRSTGPRTFETFETDPERQELHRRIHTELCPWLSMPKSIKKAATRSPRSTLSPPHSHGFGRSPYLLPTSTGFSAGPLLADQLMLPIQRPRREYRSDVCDPPSRLGSPNAPEPISIPGVTPEMDPSTEVSPPERRVQPERKRGWFGPRTEQASEDGAKTESARPQRLGAQIRQVSAAKRGEPSKRNKKNIN